MTPDFGPEAKALAESWMAQHERKLMIVAIGAREAMIESLAAAIQAFGAAAYQRGRDETFNEIDRWAVESIARIAARKGTT